MTCNESYKKRDIVKQNSGIDAIDRKIVALLQADARLSNAELGARVGASGASAWRRVKAMEKSGLLLRTVWLADPALLGIDVTVFCNVRMKSHAEAARTDFETFVTAQPQIMECHSLTGEWDYTMRIVAADIAAFNRLLMNRILRHPSVDGASSNIALDTVKYTTALPTDSPLAG